MSAERERITALDGYRGFAALLIAVINHHLIHLIPKTPDAWTMRVVRSVAYYSWSGVDAFMVLSGFLIGGIVWDHADSPNFVRAFYARRATRILPLHYATFLLYVGVSAAVNATLDPPLWLERMFSVYPSPWLSACSFLLCQNMVWAATDGRVAVLLVPAWSIAVEEQFYLLVPQIRRWLGRSALVWSAPIGFLAFPLARGMVYETGLSTNGHIGYAVLHMEPLFLGLGIAIASRVPRIWRWIHSHRWLFPLSAGALTLVLLSVAPKEGDQITHWELWWTFSLISLVWGCVLVIILSAQEGWTARFFRLRLLRWIGERSYGVYLLHSFVIFLARNAFTVVFPGSGVGHELAFTGFYLLLVFACASLSHRFLEAPFLRYGRTFSYDKT